MRTVGEMTLAALIGAGALALVSTGASAEIVCNHEGNCWHAHHGDFPDRPTLGLIIHPDGWRWEDRDKEEYRWHEHAGRGYWEGDTWKSD